MSFCRTFPRVKVGTKPLMCSLTGIWSRGAGRSYSRREWALSQTSSRCPMTVPMPAAGPMWSRHLWAGHKWKLFSPPAQHWLHDGDALLHVGSCTLGELSGLSRGISPSQSTLKLRTIYTHTHTHTVPPAPGLDAAQEQPFP